jgi:hypothetical protein
MALNNDQLKQNIFDFLKVRKLKPTPKDSANKDTSVPQDADLIEFTFEKDGKQFDKAWITIEGRSDLTLYYDDDIFTGDDGEDASKEWYQFVKELKRETIDLGIQGFRLRNKDHLNDDLKQREYHTMKEKISEGYHSMGKKASYNDAVPSIKIVLQHSRALEEGEQRYRHVERIFLENAQGERILSPTNKPGLARVYARHLAEGGVPNDERWNHIKSVCEDYSKMAGFVRATRKGQFTESAQKLVTEGLNHYQHLRETLGKMTGHRGYNTYFESWTPALMETEGDMSSLNELFVQEKLDPRIESVLPILSRLNKNLSEAALVNELSQWADDVINEEDAKPKNKKDHRAEKFKKERLTGCRCKYTNGDNKKCHIHSVSDEEQVDEALKIKSTQDTYNPDAHAQRIADKITFGNNLDKLHNIQHDTAIYRYIERYFEKNKLPEKIFGRVATKVFKKLDDTGRTSMYNEEASLEEVELDEATDLKSIPEAEWDHDPFRIEKASDYPTDDENKTALKNAVIKMWKAGKDIFEIAQELECDDVDVKDIVDNYENDGEYDSYRNDDSDYAKDHPDHPDYFNEDIARLKKLLGN